MFANAATGDRPALATEPMNRDAIRQQVETIIEQQGTPLLLLEETLDVLRTRAKRFRGDKGTREDARACEVVALGLDDVVDDAESLFGPAADGIRRETRRR